MADTRSVRDYAQCKSEIDGNTWVNRLVLLDTHTNVISLFDEDGVRTFSSRVKECKSLSKRAIWKRRNRWNVWGVEGDEICVSCTSAEVRRMFISAIDGNVQENKHIDATYESSDDQPDIWYDSNEELDDSAASLDVGVERQSSAEQLGVEKAEQSAEDGLRVDAIQQDSGCFSERGNALVDFTGDWVASEVDHNTEGFMLEMGVPWALRRVAAAANYGVGTMAQSIDQSGNRIAIRSRTPLKETTNVFTVGAGDQQMETPEGKKITIIPTWSGDQNTLLVESIHQGRTLFVKRYIDHEDRMVVESQVGEVCHKRWFSKKI